LIFYLKKRDKGLFKAEVEGEAAREKRPFKDIHVVFYLEGDIKEDKAAKAAQL
jgi:putative redox protein